MTWSEYFRIRRNQQRMEASLGVITGFLSLQSSAYYFLFVASIDPTTNIMGMVWMEIFMEYCAVFRLKAA